MHRTIVSFIVAILCFILLGCLPDTPDETPRVIDNSMSEYFPAVGTQKTKDCSVFTMVYYQFSYEYSRRAKKSYIFSPRLAWEEQNLGTGVNLYRTAIFMIDKGSPEESVYPYRASTDSTPDVWENASKYKIETVEYIKFKQDGIPLAIEQARQALCEGHILSFGTYLTSWRYKEIKDNLNSTLDDSEIGKKAVYWVYGSGGQHSLTIVGYNDTIWIDYNSNEVMEDAELGAFRVVNSYGINASDGGFDWIGYDSIYKVSTIEGAPADDVRRTTVLATALYKLILK